MKYALIYFLVIFTGIACRGGNAPSGEKNASGAESATLSQNEDAPTPDEKLNNAICFEEWHLIDAILKEGANRLAWWSFGGFTTLHNAAATKNMPIESFLALVNSVDKASIDTQDSMGQTPLHVVLKNKDQEKAKILIKADARIDEGSASLAAKNGIDLLALMAQQ